MLLILFSVEVHVCFFIGLYFDFLLFIVLFFIFSTGTQFFFFSFVLF